MGAARQRPVAPASRAGTQRRAGGASGESDQCGARHQPERCDGSVERHATLCLLDPAEAFVDRGEALFDWQQRAPGAAFSHPTPEHFLPLFVALGAAGKTFRTEWLGGGWIEKSLAADNYLFTRAL